MKGKIPAWFKELETKILDNVNGNTRKIKNEYIGRIEKSNIHINFFDENERQEKNTIVSWNDYGEFPVFAEDKKDHIVKIIEEWEYTIFSEDRLDMNNSPLLKVCESCDRNVSKKKDSKICLIYLENKNSRIIETRRKEGAIKPYEILNNLIKKNEWIKKFNNEERMNEEYNERIEKIDNLIKSEEFITIIKNIFKNDNIEEGLKKFYLMIDLIKIKNLINNVGKKKKKKILKCAAGNKKK